MQRSQIVGFALTALVLVPVLSGAQTLPYEYRTFVDTDNNSVTGCTVVVGADQFSGAEIAVTMVVDPASLAVTAVREQICAGGAWSAPVVIDNVTVPGTGVVMLSFPIPIPSPLRSENRRGERGQQSSGRPIFAGPLY